jgi:predicted Ser/Thr protein kinase
MFVFLHKVILVCVATEGFDASLIIGRGGSSCVYKGEWRGQKVAVKVLEAGDVEGGHRVEKAAFVQELQVAFMSAFGCAL